MALTDEQRKQGVIDFADQKFVIPNKVAFLDLDIIQAGFSAIDKLLDDPAFMDTLNSVLPSEFKAASDEFKLGLYATVFTAHANLKLKG